MPLARLQVLQRAPLRLRSYKRHTHQGLSGHTYLDFHNSLYANSTTLLQMPQCPESPLWADKDYTVSPSMDAPFPLDASRGSLNWFACIYSNRVLPLLSVMYGKKTSSSFTWSVSIRAICASSQSRM